MTYKHEQRRPGNVWIVVGDRARARIFSASWPDISGCEEIATLVHPESELHPREIQNEGPGYVRSAGGPRHEGEPETDYRHRTATTFAREVVERLDQARQENRFGRVVLIAPALFLGVLRSALPGPLSREVVAELDKDLTQTSAEDVASRVKELIAASLATSNEP